MGEVIELTRKCSVAECEERGNELMVGWHWALESMCPVVLCPEHGKGFRRPVVVAPPVKAAKAKHRESP